MHNASNLVPHLAILRIHEGFTELQQDNLEVHHETVGRDCRRVYLHTGSPPVDIDGA